MCLLFSPQETAKLFDIELANLVCIHIGLGRRLKVKLWTEPQDHSTFISVNRNSMTEKYHIVLRERHNQPKVKWGDTKIVYECNTYIHHPDRSKFQSFVSSFY